MSYVMLGLSPANGGELSIYVIHWILSWTDKRFERMTEYRRVKILEKMKLKMIKLKAKR